jgi:apolipoprotein N-acyltransferase
MNVPHAALTGLAGLTGLLYPLCFPNFDLGWLAWLLLIPLHVGLAGVTGRRAFFVGWATGSVGFLGTMAWVVTAMHLYGKMPLIASYAVLILLAAYLGLYVGLYAGGMTWVRSIGSRWTPLFAACLWVALELLRTYAFTGLPWALLGYSQYRWLTVVQIADLTGVYGVSFLIVLVNATAAEILLRVWRRPAASRSDGTPDVVPWPSLALTLCLVGLALLYGAFRLKTPISSPSSQAQTLSIGLVQANIDQAHKWDAAYRRETLDRYERLTGAIASTSDFIIWPEAATPFLFEQETPYRLEVSALAQRGGAPLLFGSPAIRYHPDGRPYLLNSAYLLSPRGEVVGRYDKQHLVPFGEYIPLHSLLFFLDKLVEGIGDFEAGREATVLPVPAKAATDGASSPLPRFGVVICYEVIFPDLVRAFAQRGADFMVTITNDAWFGDSSAPYQHFGMVVFRAVENRTAFARAANTGVSGFIDQQGRILDATPIFREASVTRALSLRRASTVYSEYGDLFADACAIIAALFALAARQQRRSRHAR